MDELHPDSADSEAESRGARASAKQETRAALIQAALFEFGTHGFDAPSLDAICARAGYTRGAFYVHFENRAELVGAVMEWVLGALLDAVLGTDATPGDLAHTVDLYVSLSTRGRSRLGERPDTGEGPGAEEMPLHQLLEACERAPAVGDKLRQILSGATDRLTGVVEGERVRGGVREDVGARELSSLLLLLALGLRVATDLELPIDVERSREALGRLLAP